MGHRHTPLHQGRHQPCRRGIPTFPSIESKGVHAAYFTSSADYGRVGPRFPQVQAAKQPQRDERLGDIWLRNVASGRLTGLLSPSQNAIVRSLAYSPDGRLIAIP
jgi:hypothetical protein